VFVEEVEEPLPPPIELAPPPPPRIGFHNRLALRVGLMAGALGLCLFVLLGQLPGLQVIAILAPIASGAFAVHLYKRKTGQRLSMANGAHLGWISGIFGFLLGLVVLGVLIQFVVVGTLHLFEKHNRTHQPRLRPSEP